MANPTIEPSEAVAGQLAQERGSRLITLDRDALRQGWVVAVDAETGRVLERVRNATLETPLDGSLTFTVTFLLTEPYQKTET